MQQFILSVFVFMLTALGSAASAQVLEGTKSFAPPSITPTQSSTMTIELINSSNSPATNMSFTDTYPAGMESVSAVGTTDCNDPGGSPAVVTVNTGSVSLSGGYLPAASGGPASCTVVLDVTTTSAGSFENFIPVGGLTASIGSNGGRIEATLGATLTDVTLTGARSGLTAWGGATDAYIDLNFNNSNPIDLTGGTFSVPFHPAHTLASIPGTTTCADATITTNATDIGISGATIPANGSCSMRIYLQPLATVNDNTGVNANVTIPTNSLSFDQTGVTNVTPYSINIAANTGLLTLKTFTPNVIGLSETSRVTVTYTNKNNAPLNDVTLVDALPAGMDVVPGTISTTCGNGVEDSSNTSLFTVTGADIPGSPVATNVAVTCSISADVVAPLVGEYDNVVGGSGSEIVNADGATVTPFSSEAKLTVVDNGGVSIRKFATVYGTRYDSSTRNAPGIETGSDFLYEIVFGNSTASDIGNVSLVDDIGTLLPATMHLYSADATFSGDAGCVGTLSADEATDVVSLTNATIPAGGTCTLFFKVLHGLDSTNSPFIDNTIPASAISINGTPYPVSVVGPNFRSFQPFDPRKSFSPSTVGSGGTTRMRIQVIDYRNQSFLWDEAGITVTDVLPSPLVVADDPNVSILNGCGGIVTAVPGDNTITWADFTTVGQTSNSACNMFVNVKTTGTGAGSVTNTITTTDTVVTRDNVPTPSGTTSGPGRTNRSAILNWTPIDVSIAKSFSQTSLSAGETSRLSVRITNTSALSTTLTNTGIIDNYPAGLVNAAVPNPTFSSISGTCSGGTIDAPVAGNYVELSGATVGAGATCLLEVDVLSRQAGTIVNDIPPGALTNDFGATNDLATSASLNVAPAIVVTKAFDPNYARLGEVFTGTIRIDNATAVDVELESPNGLNDTLPPEISIAAVPNITTECGIAVNAVAGSSFVGLEGGTIPAGAACVVTFDAISSTTGTFTNVIESGDVDTVNGVSNFADATAEVVVEDIDALPETFAPINPATGGSTTSVLGSDLIFQGGSAPATLSNVTITAPVPGDYTDADGNPVTGLTLDPATGFISVAIGTAPGVYSVSYEICIQGRTVCDTQIETVVVGEPPVADNDALLGNTVGTDVTLDLVDNDDADVDPTTVSLDVPSNAINVDLDTNGDVVGFEVPGEGTWSYDDATGDVTFSPELGYVGDPTVITYTVKDGLGIPSNTATVTIDYDDLPVFACTANFYEVIAGQLSVLDVSSGVYTPIGDQQPSYNATGYNVADDYVYGIGINSAYLGHVLRIGANGVVDDTGFDVGGTFFSGDVGDGNLLYFAPGPTSVRTINVLTGAASSIAFTGSAASNPLDITYFNNGQEYLVAAANGQLRRWNLTTMVAEAIPVSGLPSGDFGATWTASNGNFYASSNTDGTIYVIGDPLSATPEIIGTATAAASTTHDGMSCRAAPAPITIVPTDVEDDISTGNTVGTDVEQDIVANDDPDADPATVSLITPTGATNIITDGDGDIVGFDVPGEGTWTYVDGTGELEFSPEDFFIGQPTPVNYTVQNSVSATSEEATVTVQYVPQTLAAPTCGDTSGILFNALSFPSITPNASPIVSDYVLTNAGIVGTVGVDLLINLSPLPTPGTASDIPRVSNGDFIFNNGPNGSAVTVDVQIVETGTTTPVSGNFVIQHADTDAGEGIQLLAADIAELMIGDPSNLTVSNDGTTISVTGANGFRPTVAEDTVMYAVVGASSFQYQVISSSGNSGFNLIGNQSAPFGDIFCPDATVELVKSITSVDDTNGNNVVGDAGDTVTYDFEVINTGNVSIANLQITDQMLGLTNAVPSPSALAPGESATLTNQTYILKVTDQAAGMVENTATVTGDPVETNSSGDPIPGNALLDAGGAPLGSVSDISDTGTEPDLNGSDQPVDVANPATTDTDGTSGNDADEPTVLNLPTVTSSLAVVKSITQIDDTNNSQILDAGDTVTFTFTVENTGDTSLADVSITDTGLSPITLVPDAGFDDDLAPGETAVVASAVYVLTAADIANGGIENTATGSGSPVATLASGQPDPNTPLVDTVGDPLDPLTDTSDTGTEPAIDPTTGLPSVVANPETTETPTADNVTDNDLGNDPTALIIPAPSVQITKSVASVADTNGNGFTDAGDIVSYTFIVQNTGNTDLTGIVVTDALPGVVVSGSPIASLPIGQTNTSLTASYELLAADIIAGEVQNSATAEGTAVDSDGNPYGDPFDPGNPLTTSDVSDSGTDPDGTPVAGNELVETEGVDDVVDGDPTNDPTVFTVAPAPSIDVLKTITDVTDVNGNNVTDVGDTIDYSFTVTNTGNVALENVTIADPIVTVSGGPITLLIDGSDTTTFTATHMIDADDVDAGGVENTAVASGLAIDENGAPITDPISNLQLSATDDSDSGSEPLLDASGDPIPVGSPETTESPDLGGSTDTDPTNDPTVLIIPNPELTVVKSLANALDTNGDGLFGGEDDELHYTFTVTNTGNVDLVGITITDMPATVSGGPIDLAVGQGDSLSFSATYTVGPADITKGFVENTATATGDAVDANGDPIYGPTGTELSASDTSDTGTDPEGASITSPETTEEDPNANPSITGATGPDGDPTNDPTVSKIPGNPNPKLSVIKSVATVVDTTGDGLIGEGDTVTYAFTVTNTGNLDLADVTITDQTAAVMGGPIDLAIDDSDSTTFSATAVISAAQAAAGAIENTAQATGGAVNSLGDPILDPETGLQRTALDTSDAGTEPEVGTSGIPTPYADPEGNETPDADGDTDTDPTNDPTVLFLPMPEITITKSVASVADTNGNGFTDAGDTVSYSFAVANTGNTDLINVAVSDQLPGIVINDSPIASLLQDDVNTSVTASYVLTVADIDKGTVENTAIATGTAVDSNGDPLGDPTDPGAPLQVSDISDAGTDPNGDPVTDPETVETPDEDDQTDSDPTNDPTVFQVEPAPAISLVKSVASINDLDGDGLPGVGDEIVYSFVVTNVGNIDLTNVMISDPLGTVLGGPISLPIDGIDTGTFSLIHVITADNITDGEVENSAIATGTATDSSGDIVVDPISGNPLTTSDTSDTGTEPEIGATGTVDTIADPETTETGPSDNDPTNDPTVLVLPMPELTVVKSVSNIFDTNGDNLFGGEDDEVTYQFTVTNTGNVDLEGITLMDNLAIVSGGPIDLVAGQGDSLTFTASHIVTALDVARGYLENTAVATGNAVSATGDPLLDLNGDPIAVSDTSDTGTDPDQAMITDPNGTETPNGTGVTDNDPTNDPTVTTVPANPLPRLDIIKSVASVTDNGDGMLGAGDTVTYSFVVTNTGNVDLANVTVQDDLTPVLGGPIDLALGQSDTATFSATYVLTALDVTNGGVENTAEVTGGAVNSTGDPLLDPDTGLQRTAADDSDTGTEPEMGPTGTPQSISDPAATETPGLTGTTDTDPTNDPTVLFIPSPSISVIKSLASAPDSNGDGVFGGIGDVLNYAFVVTNTGNTALDNIFVSDLTATVSGGPISLGIGESNSTSFTATYTVTANDVNVAGYVENTADVFGDAVGSDGNPLGNPVDPGTPIMVTDTSDTGTDRFGNPISDPETNETPDGTEGVDNDPTNDPTVSQVPALPVPEIEIIKSVANVVDTDGDAVLGGEDDVVTYQFDVTNTGNTILADVVVTDTLLGGVIGTIPALIVGETESFTVDYMISEADQTRGYVENTATATGPGQNPLGTPLLDPFTGEPLTATDDSDTATDRSGDPVPDPITTENTNGVGESDGDPTNDPTVINVPLAVPDTGVSGIVYLDADEDGDFGNGDTLLPNYIVQIRDEDGDIVATTRSDGDGFYEMTGFPIGTLTIEFVDPSNGMVIGTLENLVFGRNTVLSDQDQAVEPAPSNDQIVLTKTTPVSTVVLGGTVPYQITIANAASFPVTANVTDLLPTGLLYLPGSGVLDGVATEPTISGKRLIWEDVTLAIGQTRTLDLVARVGPDAPVGDLINTAVAFDPETGSPISNRATATVRRNPEAVFDCSDIIGKVFDDRNADGYQNPIDRRAITDDTYVGGKGVIAPRVEGEPGLPNVRLSTPTGTIVTTDEYGRYSIPCAALPDDLGTNFTLKLDPRSLPTGYRVTTENPRTMHVTAGIATELNFGATIGRVIDIDLTQTAFTASGDPVERLEQGLERVLRSMADTPSMLRISYFARGEDRDVIKARLDALETFIDRRWRDIGNYRLIVERDVKYLQ